MQRLYDFRAVTTDDFPALKGMWQEIFGDSESSVDNFFLKYAKKTATLEMVPYHTKTFASGESFLDYFDL